MAMWLSAIGAMLLGCDPGTATVRSNSPFGENHLSSALAAVAHQQFLGAAARVQPDRVRLLQVLRRRPRAAEGLRCTSSRDRSGG